MQRRPFTFSAIANPRLGAKAGLAALGLLLGEARLYATENDPFIDLDATASKSHQPTSNDPFADMDATPQSQPHPAGESVGPEPVGRRPVPSLENVNDTSSRSLLDGLLHDGVSFKKEIMVELSRSSAAEGWYGRNSVGFELLKKFSTDTSTVAAFDLQMRLVRRDNYIEVLNDIEGANRRGWALEYHNLYWDFYNVFNPFLSDDARSDNAGRFNLRMGRFYVPFGLNLQTDTHGTVLQLSNERNFGFERDWYSGFWGSINAHLNYDCYYLVGSGYDFAMRGQSGMVGTRLSLSNKYLNEYGIEGGLSWLGGQRLSRHAVIRSPSVTKEAQSNYRVDTLRGGGDLRWRHPIPTGSITLTTELSAGQDESDGIFTQLYQADYLTLNRKYGASLQYRHFNQDIRGKIHPGAARHHLWEGGQTDASIVAELTYYLRNDLGNSNLRWIKLNLEQKTENQRGTYDTILTLQYYSYW